MPSTLEWMTHISERGETRSAMTSSHEPGPECSETLGRSDVYITVTRRDHTLRAIFHFGIADQSRQTGGSGAPCQPWSRLCRSLQVGRSSHEYTPWIGIRNSIWYMLKNSRDPPKYASDDEDDRPSSST